jgi:hypothetical protein
MMARPADRAEQLRKHRHEFERAWLDGVTLDEARLRIAREANADVARRLAEKQAATARCGTQADQIGHRPRWFTETRGDWE